MHAELYDRFRSYCCCCLNVYKTDVDDGRRRIHHPQIRQKNRSAHNDLYYHDRKVRTHEIHEAFQKGESGIIDIYV